MDETRSRFDRQNPSLVTWLPTLLVSMSLGCYQSSPDPEEGELRSAQADLFDAMGTKIGAAVFHEIEGGKIEVSISLRGVPDGDHGVHIHATPECTAPDFKSAQGHWNPTMEMHGAPGDGHMHHAGDLGNVTVNSNSGRSKVTLEGVNIKDDDELSILKHSVIVHELLDDFMTQMPPGNAGARIGCGLVELSDGMNDQPPQDPPPARPNAMIQVAGKVSELGAHFAALGGAAESEQVVGASISTIGLSPEQNTMSDAGAAYKMSLPQNGKTIVHATKQGYFPTYVEVTTTANNISGKRLYIVASQYMASIGTTYGVDLENPFACHAPPRGGLSADQQCVYGIIFGQIIDDGSAANGAPTAVAGVTADEVTISGPDGADWYYKGPYFLTSTAAPSLGTLRSDRNGLFVSFVEIPATEGSVSLDFRVSIAHQGSAGKRYFGPVDLKIYRPYGVTWSYVRETGQPAPMPGGGMGMGMPDPGEPVDFDTQIYPLFLSVTQGGYGCLGCHTNAEGAEPAAGMNLYGGPATAFASLDPANYPMRVNTAMPSMSLLLQKPLYEDNGPQDHPIFAFTSKQDAGYVLIQNWIRQGAKRDAPVNTVSFANDVVKLLASPTGEGGSGCVTCHGVAPYPGNFAVDGGPDAIYAELTTEVPADDGATGELLRINALDPTKSLLLTNPLLGSAEPHPVKIFSSNADSRYQTLYRWISEGALKN